jgi:hypothetical protein
MQSSDDRQERDGLFDPFFDELRKNPEWWAETTLARQALAHILTIMKGQDEELAVFIREPPKDDVGLLALGTLLVQHDEIVKRGVHEHLKKLFNMLRAHIPGIERQIAYLILMEWLLPQECPERDSALWYFLKEAMPRPGRPAKLKQDSAEPKTQKQQRIDPVLAARAYHLHSDGRHWTAIARELLPSLNLYDPRQREQARARVSRLIERGRLNAR